MGSEEFPATTAGYEQLNAWLHGFGEVEAVAVESTSSYAAGLTRALTAHGVVVVEVNQLHAHSRRRRGKSDAVDAELAARRYLTVRKTLRARLAICKRFRPGQLRTPLTRPSSRSKRSPIASARLIARSLCSTPSSGSS